MQDVESREWGLLLMDEVTPHSHICIYIYICIYVCIYAYIGLTRRCTRVRV